MLKRLSGRVADPKVASELLRLQKAVTRVDVAAARARYGTRLGAQPVVFSRDEGGLSLRGLLHPLLVWRGNEGPNTTGIEPQVGDT